MMWGIFRGLWYSLVPFFHVTLPHFFSIPIKQLILWRTKRLSQITKFPIFGFENIYIILVIGVIIDWNPLIVGIILSKEFIVIASIWFFFQLFMLLGVLYFSLRLGNAMLLSLFSLAGLNLLLDWANVCFEKKRSAIFLSLLKIIVFRK